MKDLLKRMDILEHEMEKAQEQSEYWIEEEHFDEEKSELFEQKADEIYKSLYKLFDQAADKIVSITSGRIDKGTAMVMIRRKRSEVARIFA